MYSRAPKVSKHPLRLKQVNGLRTLQFLTDTSTYTLFLHDESESTASEAINVESYVQVREGEPLKIYQLPEMTLQSVNFREVKNGTLLTASQTPVLIESRPID